MAINRVLVLAVSTSETTMIRLLNAHFPSRTIFLGVSEACLVSFAFLIATFMRLGTDEASIMLAYDQGIVKIAVVLIAFSRLHVLFRSLQFWILTNRREAVVRMIQVLGTECILLALVYYVYPPLELGRGIFLIGFALMAVLLFLWRRLFARLNVLPRFAQRTMIFGDGPLAEPLLYEFGSRPELGVNVVSHLASTNGLDSQSGNHEASPSTLSRRPGPVRKILPGEPHRGSYG